MEIICFLELSENALRWSWSFSQPFKYLRKEARVGYFDFEVIFLEFVLVRIILVASNRKCNPSGLNEKGNILDHKTKNSISNVDIKYS